MKNVLTALTEERIFMKKTKIVCTLGPATDDDNVLRELIKSGMDCARSTSRTVPTRTTKSVTSRLKE